MRKVILLAAVAAFGMAGQAFAKDGPDLSYSYAEADYISTKLDDDGTFGTDIDGNGWGLMGAMSFNQNFHGYLEYQSQDFDFDINIETWELGLGVNWPLAPTTDLIGRIAYAKADADFEDLNVFDDDGYALQAGVRSLLSDRFELEGLAHYVDLSDTGDGTTFRVTGRYHFTDMFTGTIGAEIDSDTTMWMLGVRLNFPR